LSLSKENELLIVSKARVTNIEFTFDGEDPQNVTKRRRRKAGPLSVHPDNEPQVLEAALEAFRKRYPIEVYEDTNGRIVKIHPTNKS
jgi:hypothetical protein